MIFGRSTKSHDEERGRLADELAGLRADIKQLRTERDRTSELTRLHEDIEKLKLEKGRLVEENDRKIRETEHKTGLLRTKTEQDIVNARRETTLQVREENLSADRQRFAAEMEFQRTRLQGEVDRIDGIMRAILDRLPSIEVELSGSAVTRKESKSAKYKDSED